MNYNYHIYNIGDHALVVTGGQKIDPLLHAHMVQLANFIKEKDLPGVKDLIVAYASLTIYYDPLPLKKHFPLATTVFEGLSDFIRESLHFIQIEKGIQGRTFHLPVCYEASYAKDLKNIALTLGMETAAIIQAHTAQPYKIYMIGFIPGFPYMASLPAILHTARKSNPEQVAAGSVAIAGAQTGIYPVDSPGGWNIIGRTPIQIFNKRSAIPVCWQPGDEVQFHTISAFQFQQIEQNPTSWPLQ